MSCLDATFTLTPGSPVYADASRNGYAYLYCYGADFLIYGPMNLTSLYASNRFFFLDSFGGDPNLDYAQWVNRKNSQYSDFLFRHFSRMPFFVINDEPLDPVDVSLFGADGVVLAPNDIAHLIEQFGFAHRWQLHYALRHGRDYVLPIPKLKPD